MINMSSKLVPLDKQQLPIATSQETGGHGRQVTKPALDPYWKEDVNFMRYQPPPTDGDEASLEEWSERLSYIEEDLHWLLKQTHQKFWSQVVFDDTLQHSLDSYLHHAPRPYDGEVMLPEALSEMHQRIHRLTFMVFLRMATYKESKEDFITQKVFGNILYENFLFDVVKIMELCILYGDGNAKLLGKMVNNIFTNQPRYNDDLQETVPTILEVLDMIQAKCGKGKEGGGGQSLKKLGASLDRDVESMSAKELQDVVFYIMDTAQSLNAFLEIYPQAAMAFNRKEIVSRVASFYEALMPELEKAVKKLNWESQSLRNQVRKQLHLAQVGLAQVCATVVSECFIRPVLERSSSMDNSTHLDHIDNYVELIASLLSDKHFLTAFTQQCDIEADIDLIGQSTDQIDETRMQFIIDGVRLVKTTRRKHKQQPSNHGSMVGASGNMVAGHAGKSSDERDMVAAAPEDYQTDTFLDEYGSAPIASNQVSGVELVSLISGVKDLFPEIGEGFIEACLEEYNYDTSKVINDILEDKLVPALQELDRNLPRRPTPPPSADPHLPPDPAATDVFHKRANIFENDEFDIFTRDDVDTSKIHKGKKLETDTAYSVLADKSVVKELKSVYDEYNYEYEDEYDDTYDANDVGAGDADSADELTSRSLLGPLRRRQVLGEASPADEEDSEDEDKDGFERAPLNTRGEKFYRPKYPPRGPANKEAKQAALQGQQKGKGQSQTTQNARNNKDKHKSSRANHNRKAMADKKRSKGMGPLG